MARPAIRSPMSFLAPLFLLGALAVTLPVVFHLARRTARERTIFSSLLFLRPTPPRLTRRNRLEHLLLLLLRCLVIGLLALGFARPFWRQATSEMLPDDPARRLVILVDTSASLRRDGLWAEARDRVAAVLRQISPADQVALCAFDRAFTPLVTFEQWTSTAVGDRAALALNRLRDVTPGWSATALDQALIRAAEWLGDAEEPPSAAGRRQIVLISDLQAGSRLTGLQGYEWPKNLEVAVERLTLPRTSNAGLQLAPELMDDVAVPAELTVRLRVNNAPDATREAFQLGWARAPDTPVGTNLNLYVPAGQGRVVALPVPAAEAGADRVILRGDDEDFDNTLFIVPPTPARVTVLYLGRDVPGDPRQPRYFLERAFRETRRQIVQVVGTGPAETGSGRTFPAASLIVVTDLVDDLEALRQPLAQGRTILFVPPDPAAVSAVARLPELTGLSAEEGRFANYGLLGEIDFRHPVFAPFADPRFSDFTKIHFWKYRRLDLSAFPGVRVLARFDNGDPALAEIPAGPGRLLVLASGWHPADSQLARSTRFVPLLYAILESSGAAQPAPVSYLVGERVPLTRDPARSGSVVTVMRPGGLTATLASTELDFSDTQAPGVYRLDAGVEPARFAVNLDPAESRTTPLPADELERLGVPMARPAADPPQVAARAARLRDTELESRQKLWRWVILATLVMLIVETWLAGWTARRALLPAPANP